MDNRNKYSSLGRYAGLAVQWFVMLALAVWGGIKLDEVLHMKALFVIIFPLLALGVSLYQVIRDSNNKNTK